jgi:hypothetical protein
MNIATSFGQYNFPQNAQTDISDNFRDVVTRTQRMPGLSGGFDEFGTGEAPTEIGTVRVSWWFKDASEARVQAERDSVAKMLSYGKSSLYIRKMGTGEMLFASARIQNIQMSQNAKNMAHQRQLFQATFQVSDPYWYGIGTEFSTWGASIWGNGVWGGGATASAIACAGVTTSASVSVGGNAYTQPRLVFSCDTGQSASDIYIQRLVRGEVIDQVRYNGSLVAGDKLEINCRLLTVKKNNSDSYSSIFTFTTGAWMRLAPTSNNIRVLLSGVTDAGTLKTYYYEAWR